jgi:predicted restriction endonuclease
MSDIVRKAEKDFSLPSGQERKPRRQIDKELVKKLHGNRCRICRKTEKQVGELQMAHIKAHSKGGNEVVPLCPTCHRKYDKGLLTVGELKKLGLSQKEYNKYRPKKPKPRKNNIFAL